MSWLNLSLKQGAAASLLAVVVNLLADFYIANDLTYAVVSALCCIVVFIAMRPVLNYIFRVKF